MEINKKQIIYILLVMIWMIVVFFFSNQSSDVSSKQSGGITETVVKVIKKDNKEISQNEIDTIETIVRKCAHFTLYTIGGILVMNCIYTTKIQYKRKFIYAILFLFLYAITDEVHQLFVSGRSGEITDVLLDTIGSCFGIVIFSRLIKYKRR